MQKNQNNLPECEGRIRSETWTDSQTAKKAGVGVGK